MVETVLHSLGVGIGGGDGGGDPRGGGGGDAALRGLFGVCVCGVCACGLWVWGVWLWPDPGLWLCGVCLWGVWLWLAGECECEFLGACPGGHAGRGSDGGPGGDGGADGGIEPEHLLAAFAAVSSVVEPCGTTATIASSSETVQAVTAMPPVGSE